MTAPWVAARQRAADDAANAVGWIDEERDDLTDLIDRLDALAPAFAAALKDAPGDAAKAPISEAMLHLDDARDLLNRRLIGLQMDRADHQATIERAEI